MRQLTRPGWVANEHGISSYWFFKKTNFHMKISYYLSTLLLSLMLTACGSPSDTPEEATEPDAMPQEISFLSSLISQEANLWWARTLADVNGDGILDVVLQDNNGGGGWLGYLKGNIEGHLWEPVIISGLSPNGKPFAAGDLDAGDIDGDGDVDLIGVEHPGEWTDSGAPAHLFWYEQSNTGWNPHPIGTIPSFLKDISLADLNRDGLPEIITVSFDAETLTIFTKTDGPTFAKVQDIQINNLHEGMDVGDLDGDGRIDIAANGYWLKNPGSLSAEWAVDTIDQIWHNQEGDWSANATKTVCRDTDGDGRAEVFITHSERAGYPVARYTLIDGRDWRQDILLDSLPAAHSLVVADMDLDGSFEVLTGVNRNRARDIGVSEFPVYLLENRNGAWNKQLINDEGVYNLLAGDLEGDGDVDLIRLTTHDAREMEVMANQSK